MDVFFKHFSEAADHVHGAKGLGTDQRRQLMSQHTKFYKLLQPGERRDLELQARRLSIEREEAVQQQLEEATTAQALATARLEHERQLEGLTNFASHCQIQRSRVAQTRAGISSSRDVVQEAPS